jgi:hypothetical protein
MAAQGSSVLLYERFEAGDPRFLDELFTLTAQGKLRAFADRWLADPRPVARQALFRYIDDGCDRPGHRVLVKALFKRLEAAGDDEVMGHFMVAFDRLPHRSLKVRSKGVYPDYTPTSILASPRGVPQEAVPGVEPERARFSMRTRTYLCRRAFRYFRRIGKRDLARYGRAIRGALALYDDASLQKPEQLLDAWGLLNALYWGSPAINRTQITGARLARGHTLAELEPAPMFPGAWQRAFEETFAMLERAKSRIVRTFAIALLRRDYADKLSGIPVRRLLALLASPHEELQTFASEVIGLAEGVEGLTVAEWLDLLRLDNPIAVLFLADLVKRHVTPGRLSLEQCVELAKARPAPVAELGLAWAKLKPIQNEAAVSAVVSLKDAEAPRVREEAIAWVTQIIERSPHARAEHLRDLVDAKHADVRKEALAAMRKTLRYKESTELWGAFFESPYEDVRSFLVAHLTARQAMYAPETLRHLWVTTLLAVHRGSRDKRAVIEQIADRIIERPAEAEALLPLLGVALRSVREPERRAALAALARAAFERPALRMAISAKLPELKLFDEAH